jgi:Domain of unknown function (DUF5664)/Domain of unknown function (DUF4406)
MKRTAYLSGPMRGVAAFNFPAFHEAEERGKAADWLIISPARMDEQHGFDPATASEESVRAMNDVFVARDLAAIQSLNPNDGDAIAMLPGWEKSTGARAEHAVAVWRKLRVLDARTFEDLAPEVPVGRVLNSADAFFAPPDGIFSLPLDTRAIDATPAEVRVVDPKTGGAKGEKPERFDLLPWDVLAEDARLYARGAQKYDARNWEAGYAWHLSFAALMRHATAFWQRRQSNDPETGHHELACVRFHAAALMRFDKAGIGTDDRPGAEAA